MMSEAQTETDLWRHAIILPAIVDGRFHGDDVKVSGTNRFVDRYGTSFNDMIRCTI